MALAVDKHSMGDTEIEDASSCAKKTDTKSDRVITENGITIKEPNNKKSPGKHNPKLSVFREFVLATVHTLAKEHVQKQSAAVGSDGEGSRRQFFACDLITQTGIAGLQWKKHIGEDIHVTVAEHRDPQHLQDSIHGNGFTASKLPLDPKLAAGNLLTHQSPSEVHHADCNPTVLMHLEAFDFVYVDPHKNPAPYFGCLFRNIRNGGTVCVVVPDTMHFARCPHLVRRSYGSNCIKTSYLKELAVRTILASLAEEAAKCNKGVTVLYAISKEDYLLLCMRVERGPKFADSMAPNIGHVLHCRICEERAFYPGVMAPIEDPYSIIGCDCQKNVPGKTGVILGPLWKGSIYEYSCLTKLAAAGKALSLSTAFFTLLQRVMEDCLCDTPPTLLGLMQGLCDDSDPLTRLADSGASAAANGNRMDAAGKEASHSSAGNATLQQNDKRDPHSVQSSDRAVLSSSDNSHVASKMEDTVQGENGKITETGGVKRSAPDAGTEESPRKLRRQISMREPSPCFYYNVHSKTLAKDNLPKQHAIVERLRSHGYRCCRTHFEKYAIRTNANQKTLTALLGSGQSKVLYVKGSAQS